MAKIEAPNKEFNGPGPGDAKFKDGVAHTDDPSAINYYRAAGYAVDGDGPDDDTTEPPDPREVGTQLVGSPLRDAAVDPEAEDFLPPINAGKGNPHGSTVVSPEVHASGPKGIRPGGVHVEDAAKQQARESAYAEARLVQQTPADKAAEAEVGDLDARGGLDLSDPGSAEAGEQAAKEQPSEPARQTAKKSAKKS